MELTPLVISDEPPIPDSSPPDTPLKLSDPEKQLSVSRDQIRHLLKVTDQQSTNLVLLERRLDNLDGHFCSFAEFNRSLKYVSELQEQLSQVEEFREQAARSISQIRERQHDMLALEKLSQKIEKENSKIQKKYGEIVNQQAIDSAMSKKRMRDVEEQMSKIQYEMIRLEKMEDQMKEKATYEDIKQTEMKIKRNYLLKSTHQDFVDKFNILQSNTNNDFQEKQEKLSRIQIDINNIKCLMKQKESDDQNFQISCIKTQNESNQKINQLEQDNIQNKESLIRQNEILITLDKSKTSVTDFSILKTRIDKFTNIEEVLIPKIEKFSKMIDSFIKDNNLMRECIRRFDEDLSLKANKGQLTTMQSYLETQFITSSHWDHIKSTICQLQENIHLEISKFHSQIQKITEDAGIEKQISKAIETNFKEYNKVMVEFKKFFNQEQLSETIDSKADVEMIKEIQQQKADKYQIEEIHALINKLKSRMYEISLLQQQMAISLVPSKTSVNRFDHQNKSQLHNKFSKIAQNSKIVSSFLSEDSIKSSFRKKIKYDELFMKGKKELMLNGKKMENSINDEEFRISYPVSGFETPILDFEQEEESDGVLTPMQLYQTQQSPTIPKWAKKQKNEKILVKDEDSLMQPMFDNLLSPKSQKRNFQIKTMRRLPQDNLSTSVSLKIKK